jgi:hypothetical protein
MDTVEDFEDLLELLDRHGARYLIVGGLAFIYHAKPRYTKDMDLWLDADRANVERVNLALADFGSPHLLDPANPDEILQLGAPPNRIDLIRSVIDLEFESVWARRIEGRYGRARANWIDLDSLIAIKSGIDHPRHQEDARILRLVRDRIETDD